MGAGGHRWAHVVGGWRNLGLAAREVGMWQGKRGCTEGWAVSVGVTHSHWPWP